MAELTLATGTKTVQRCEAQQKKQYEFGKIALIKLLSQLESLHFHFHYPLKITFRKWRDRRQQTTFVPCGAFNANKTYRQPSHSFKLLSLHYEIIIIFEREIGFWATLRASASLHHFARALNWNMILVVDSKWAWSQRVSVSQFLWSNPNFSQTLRRNDFVK